jgi:hypothetical protein
MDLRFSSAASTAVQLSARSVSWLPDRRSLTPSQASSPVALGKELPGHSGGPAPALTGFPILPNVLIRVTGPARLGTPCDVAARLAGIRQLSLAAIRVVRYPRAQPYRMRTLLRPA